jgi:hypothetical protein
MKFLGLQKQARTLNRLGSKPSIEKPWKWFEKMGYPVNLKQLDGFYVQQFTRAHSFLQTL